MDIKECERKIRWAFCVDRELPKPKNAYVISTLWKMPFNNNAFDDTDLTNDDLENWHEVLFEWLPLIKGLEKEVVKSRCRGMSWKKIGQRLVQKGFCEETLSRVTLWRIFKAGLNRVMNEAETLKRREF